MSFQQAVTVTRHGTTNRQAGGPPRSLMETGIYLLKLLHSSGLRNKQGVKINIQQRGRVPRTITDPLSVRSL